MPLCARDARPRVRMRCGSKTAADETGRAAAVSSAIQRTGDDGTAWLAGGATGREEDGAELGAGKGDHISASPLEAVDVVSAAGRGSIGQQHCRKGFKACCSPQKERTLLPHAERRGGRRSVHEPDPYLSALRSQLV